MTQPLGPRDTLPLQDNTGKSSLWECLNAGHATVEGTAEDRMGLEEIVGLEIWEASTGNGSPEMRTHALGNENISKWIDTELGTKCEDKILCCKVLVGMQVVQYDGLRPPDNSSATWFSREKLRIQFKFPATAVERISINDPWCMEFISRNDSPTSHCEGLGTQSFGFLQCVDDKSGMRSGMFIFFCGHSREEAAKLLSDTKTLSHLALEREFLPYQFTSLLAQHLSDILETQKPKSRDRDLRLLRFADERTLDSLFFGAHSAAAYGGHISRDVQMALKFARKSSESLTRGPPGISDSESLDKIVRRQELLDGFRYLTQVLQTNSVAAERFQEHTARQLQTVLGMIARAQQVSSIEIAQTQSELARLSRQDQITSIAIAESTRIIAEETKRDGTSMKTLAIVTMSYLPCTAISSIFAMPFFDWRADHTSVVSPRLWVYFVLALPLTGITIGSWWVWQRRLTQGRHLSAISKC